MDKTRSQDWIDTIAKLLLPLMIFLAGLVYSYQKDKNERVNKQFERDSGILKLAASSNEKERTLGLKIIEIQQSEGTFSKDLLPVVQAISQGIPSEGSTRAAKDILAAAVKDDPAVRKDTTPTAPSKQSQLLYLQIAREDQRSEAATVQTKLQAEGFSVQAIELVAHPTNNNYVRYFSPADKALGMNVLGILKDNGLTGYIQDFTSVNHGDVSPGTIEVWFGVNQPSVTN